MNWDNWITKVDFGHVGPDKNQESGIMKERRLLETMRPLLLIVLALALVAGVACGENEDSKPADNNQQADVGTKVDVEEEDEEFALIGIWGTTNNDSEIITATKWDRMSIVEFNNEERWVITQNPADDLSANKYNKILWTPIVRKQFYYCMIEIGRNELDQVKNSTAKADDSDPTKGGCPAGTIQKWSLLTEL